ncbi:MAG: hypothetical protein QXU32_10420 [Nitrososphaerales archaeon]
MSIEIRKKATKELEPEIGANGSITWDRVMEVANHEEVVNKLTLKYLR